MLKFDQIFNSFPQIKNYFTQNASNPNEYIQLATELILQSIKKKVQLSQTQLRPFQPTQQKSTKILHKAAQIKNNRFLSPSQKKQVTPKVTEVIPVSPQKIIIYGKPKVKLDNNFGCASHQQNCEQQETIHEPPQRDNQIKNKKSSLLQQDNPYQYEECLLPKNKANKKAPKRSIITRTVDTIQPAQNRLKQNTIQRTASTKSLIKKQNYSKVPSKIKDLIQRDKRNRQLQKQIQKQKQRIAVIQQTQQRLKTNHIQQKSPQKLENAMQYKSIPQRTQPENKYFENAVNQICKFKTSQPPDNVFFDDSENSSQFKSSSEQEVNLHEHKGERSRIECYECEMERLRRRKVKAEKAIQNIKKEQKKRNRLLKSIASGSQLYKSSSYSQSNISQRSNSITIQ